MGYTENMQDVIRIRGAREHNLKNIDLDIKRNQFVVLTGLSGSGKSSIAFDTIYAEGQRRYVESLSSYARLFLGQMHKPDLDAISGLSPTIAIDQKTTSNNPRSTVGTVTEIYDYLRLLYARVGEVHCPHCGKRIDQQSPDQMLARILSYPEGTKLMILAPIVRERKGEYGKEISALRRDGFVRIRIDGEMMELDSLEDDFKLEKRKNHTIDLVVDRLILREGIRSRLADSLETALQKGHGLASVRFIHPPVKEGEAPTETEELFSENFACPDCHISIGEITPRLFSFNSPYGACPECSGLGELVEIDPELVVHNPDLSINDGAIQAIGWNFADRKSWARAFIEALSRRYDFSLDTAWKKLPKRIREIILYGNHGEILEIDTSHTPYPKKELYRSDWAGVVPTMNKRYMEHGSDDYKEFYTPFLSIKSCPSCHGARLKAEALAISLGGLNIYELCRLPVLKIREHLESLQFGKFAEQVSEPILIELRKRLGFLHDVGLSYLSLSRSASTLSGGEAQRIRLATQIGSGLMGVIYILDEPSIGLHQRDNRRLLQTLFHLRDLGNTVLVVEHDEETIRSADEIIDIGPGAGEAGGYLVAQGSVSDIEACEASITGQYLSGRKSIEVPKRRRSLDGPWLSFYNCRENNLKGIDIQLPLRTFICVTGVSGSGKSSFVNATVAAYLRKYLNGGRPACKNFDRVEGADAIDKLIVIDQSPIGRTPRSNPATYTGLFDDVRRLFASTREARARGYKPGRFSFNVKGGRCETCKGDGEKRIEMHFLPDIYVECEVCHGKRYNRETLEVRYRDKTIADVLNMTVAEAITFFADIPSLKRRLETLEAVGLSYIRLGQSSTELSGGEAQRVKLASELAKRGTGKTLYILDEPTTGLHTADVHRLIDILQRLTENGNTVLVIEHNLDVIKTADYIIDIGPEGGDEGGSVVTCGTPEEVAKCKISYTGQYLSEIL